MINEISYNRLSGNIQLSHLPPILRVLALGCNAFTGTPNLRCLPSTLTILALHKNSFEGLLHLDCLPSKLKELTLSDNAELEGRIKRTDFPKFLDESNIQTSNTKIVL